MRQQIYMRAGEGINLVGKQHLCVVHKYLDMREGGPPVAGLSGLPGRGSIHFQRRGYSRSLDIGIQTTEQSMPHSLEQLKELAGEHVVTGFLFQDNGRHTLVRSESSSRPSIT